jgi:hypothetical protein
VGAGKPVRNAWPPCPPVQLTCANDIWTNASALPPCKVAAATPCYACVHTPSLCRLDPSPPSLSFAQARIALTRCAAIKGVLSLAFCPRHPSPIRSGKQTTAAPIFYCRGHRGQHSSPSLLPVLQVAEHYVAPGVLPEPLEQHLPRRRVAAPSLHRYDSASPSIVLLMASLSPRPYPVGAP